MSESFNPKERSIAVRVRIKGPAQVIDATLALDTGATTTMISPSVLLAAGYDPSQAKEHALITSATGITYVPKMRIGEIQAIGVRRPSLKVLAAALPPSAGVDGLLGLDFFRRKRLTIDFRKGKIDLR